MDEFPWSELMYGQGLTLEQKFDCLTNVLEHMVNNSYETKKAKSATHWFSDKTKKLLSVHTEGITNPELEKSLQDDYDSHVFKQSLKFTKDPNSMWKSLQKLEKRNVSACRLKKPDGTYTEDKKEQATLLTKTNISKMNPFSEFKHIELEDDIQEPWIDNIEIDEDETHIKG